MLDFPLLFSCACSGKFQRVEVEEKDGSDPSHLPLLGAVSWQGPWPWGQLCQDCRVRHIEAWFHPVTRQRRQPPTAWSVWETKALGLGFAAAPQSPGDLPLWAWAGNPLTTTRDSVLTQPWPRAPGPSEAFSFFALNKAELLLLGVFLPACLFLK